jgi:hypothetical protein
LQVLHGAPAAVSTAADCGGTARTDAATGLIRFRLIHTGAHHSMYSVPVRSNSYQGIGELKGILRFDGTCLTLQYQTADPILAEFRAPPVDLDLPAPTIVNAQFRSGFLGLAPEIEIRVSDFRHLAKLPVAEAGRLRLRVPRRDRGDARKVVEEINALCAQHRLAQLDASISRMAQQAADAAGRSRND